MTEAESTIAVHPHPHVTRVQLHGAFDLEAAPHFRDVVSRLAGAPRLVVDLRGLDFVDSRGLQELVALDAATRQDGRALALVRARGFVEEPFRITGLDTLFDFVDD